MSRTAVEANFRAADSFLTSATGSGWRADGTACSKKLTSHFLARSERGRCDKGNHDCVETCSRLPIPTRRRSKRRSSCSVHSMNAAGNSLLLESIQEPVGRWLKNQILVSSVDSAVATVSSGSPARAGVQHFIEMSEGPRVGATRKRTLREPV